MGPISALSFACNVFQLVEFSIESAKVCKELYDNGSLDESNRIEKYSAGVTAAHKDLQAALSSGKSAYKPSRIVQVAQDASATANELRIVLNQLKLSKTHGIRRLGGAFKNTLKTLVSSGTIKKLQQRLERQDAVLRSNILKDLYIKAGERDLAQKKEFQSLSDGQKNLIIQILETQRLLSTELNDSIKSSEVKIAARLSAQDAQLDKSARQHDLQIAILLEEKLSVCKRRLLKALAFPEINERRNMIEERVNDFGNTYRWIFNTAHTENIRSGVSPPRSTVSNESVGQDVKEETLGGFEGEDQAVSEAIPILEKNASLAAKEDDVDDQHHPPESNLPLACFHENKQAAANVRANTDDGDIEPGSTFNRIDLSSFEADGTQQPHEVQNASLSESASFKVSESPIEPMPHKYLPEHVFVNWLQRGTDLFWISGKPGSGKSTLMDYIYHNIQPGEIGFDLIKTWAGSHSVVILTFWFFRPASTPLLKTLNGFWRSLCFQILDSDPNLAKNIREDRDGTAPSALRSCLLPNGSNAESWTDNELKSWFWYMIEHTNMRYCILIDGLDEIESSRELLLETVLSMSARCDKLKLCCACRPENPFQNILKQHQNLRLQDFNQGDIEEDCKRRLKGTRAEKLADQIADRAEGLFLWAHLISENLARAARDGESEEDLDLRLKECPDEMNELFRYMLLRQDKLYAKRPKPYLQLVDLASRTRGRNFFTRARIQTTLLELLVATLPSVRSPKWSELSGKFDVGFLSYLEENLDGLGPRIESTCVGLVQCLAPDHTLPRYWNALKSDPTFPRLDDAVETQVVLIHRSVHDFLREDEGGAAYYQRFTLIDDEAASMLMAAAACPLFFSNEKLGHSFKPIPIDYAQALGRDSCDVKSIAVMDAFFKQLELRSAPTPKNNEISYYGLRLISHELSLYENLSMGFSSEYELDTYVQIKILEADPRRQHILAAYALCTYLRMSLKPFRGELVTTLSTYLDALQAYKFIYRRDAGRGARELTYPANYIFDVISTRPLIDHVAASPGNAFQWHDYHLAYVRLPSGFFDPYVGRKLDFGFVETWLVAPRYTYVGYLQSLPTPDDDCAYLRDDFKNTMVVVFQIGPQDMMRTDIFHLKVVRWSPCGTKRFFPINKAVEQNFRRSHSGRSWDVLLQNSNAAFVKGLNSPPDDMTEKELEEIKNSNINYLAVDEDNKFKIAEDSRSFLSGRISSFVSLETEDDLLKKDEDIDRLLFGTEVKMPLSMKQPPDSNLPLILRDGDNERDGQNNASTS